MADIKLVKVEGSDKKAIPAKQLVQLSAPPIDSLKYANDLIDKYTVRDAKGNIKQFDTTDPTLAANKKLAPAIQYLHGQIIKDKEKIDSAYNEAKMRNPDLQGWTARDIDAVVPGRGQHYMDHVNAYERFRALSKIKENPSKKIVFGPSSFGSTNTSTTIPLYSPDMGAATIKNTR